MDTTSLQVACGTTAYPPAHQDAVRHGVRLALELLRSPVLPAQVLLSDSRFSPQPDAWAMDRQSGAPVVDLATDTVIAMSYPGIVSRAYLGPAPYPEPLVRSALGYCGAYAGARYALRFLDESGNRPWGTVLSEGAYRPEDTGLFGEDDGDQAERVAGAVAAAGSGWTLAALGAEAERDPQSGGAMFFLRRLAAIRRAEGPAAVWRGVLGGSIRAFVREVRFSDTPGVVSRIGHRVPSAANIVWLLRYAEGRAEWPFPHFPVTPA